VLKKILMIGPDLQGLGGISRVVTIWRAANFFEGYDFRYVATSPASERNKLGIMLRALFSFAIAVVDANIIYIHSAAYTSFYRKSIFLYIAKIFRRKVILHIHPSEFIDFYTNLSGFLQNYSFYALYIVDEVVVLTYEMREYLLDIFPNKNIHVLRNAINIAHFSDPQNLDRTKTEIIFLGWYIPEKGVFDLVDAIALIHNANIPVKLNFYGTKQVVQLNEYIASKHLDSVITVHNWIDEDTKLHALYRSRMLVLPSHSEGLPNVILEAMATHTPIVATSVGGLKEVLRDNENALIARVNDPSDIAAKISLLLQDDQLCVRLADSAYHDALKHYDIAVIREKFRNILQSV